MSEIPKCSVSEIVSWFSAGLVAKYEELSNQSPTPFQWRFDRAKLTTLLAKIEARHKLFTDAQLACLQEAA